MTLTKLKQRICALLTGHSYGPETPTNIAYMAFDVVKTCRFCECTVTVHEDVPAAHHPSRQKSITSSPYETAGDRS